MFRDNNKQYVNILKRDDQVKIDFKIVEDSKIQKQEHSSFLVKDDTMPQDAQFKLDTLQKTVSHTYLTSLYTQTDQILVKNENIDKENYSSIPLDERYSVSVAKEQIIKHENYFEKSGIDYIVSAYSLLYNIIKNNKVDNSLNILVYNNTLYIIILDNNKQISFSTVLNLTPFANIKESNFYNDDIIGQKLYDEIHFLEIQQCLNDTIKNYYESDENIQFLDKINIYYSIKQLSDDQLDILYETLMVNVSYDQISIDSGLYNITQSQNAKKYSFIDPREKKADNKMLKWVGIAAASIVVAGMVIYYKTLQSENAIPVLTQNSTKTIEDSNKTSLKEEEYTVLPNHIKVNNELTQQALMLFDIVPFDVLLQELEIKEDESTFVANFITDSDAAVRMQDNLLRLYKESKVILEHKNKAITSRIIANSSLIKEEKQNNDLLKYKKYKFLTNKKVQELIENRALKGTSIKFVSKKGKADLSYLYHLNSTVKEPNEFFSFVEELNKQDYSIHLTYPFTFAKVKEGIKVEYGLIFNQKIESAAK
ncbi:MAG: hypothetical protein U9Q33_09785 [Campylobacterota bacterium]|nr:hypothetical protein [Campylobacterota bacterium]